MNKQTIMNHIFYLLNHTTAICHDGVNLQHHTCVTRDLWFNCLLLRSIRIHQQDRRTPIGQSTFGGIRNRKRKSKWVRCL